MPTATNVNGNIQANLLSFRGADGTLHLVAAASSEQSFLVSRLANAAVKPDDHGREWINSTTW